VLKEEKGKATDKPSAAKPQPKHKKSHAKARRRKETEKEKETQNLFMRLGDRDLTSNSDGTLSLRLSAFA